jgi:hypothetical protein
MAFCEILALMKPNKDLISIGNNEEQIKELLSELVLNPRLNALKWSKLTKQTPNIKIGYPGQHLASLITGMPGERTGARGNDLIDGTEVKSCSRIDQLDLCKTCGASVARSESICSVCGSDNINRKDDSKWLLTIRSEADLRVLTVDVNRVLLLIGDYPNFDEGDYSTLRFQAFEIWTQSPRNKRFAELMTNYYYKIYLEHKKNNPAKTPAPKNFWPFSYQFYLCNPIPVFISTVLSADSKPTISIDYYIQPEQDRSELPSAMMPVSSVGDSEIELLFNIATPEELQACLKDGFTSATVAVSDRRDSLKYIDERLRSYLPLRDTDKISVSKKEYIRRKVV